MESAFIDEICEHMRERKIEIKTIFDVGACDFEESIYLAGKFPEAIVRAFEANPDKAPLLVMEKPDRHLFFRSCAVGSENKEIDFHIGDDPKQSSVYPISEDKFRNLLHMEVRTSRVAKVQMIRLDSLLKTPDLLFMDIQCSEKEALIGLGDRLKDVKVIATELMLKSTYDCEPPFDAVDAMLKEHFELVRGNPFEGIFDNFIYIRRDLI